VNGDAFPISYNLSDGGREMSHAIPYIESQNSFAFKFHLQKPPYSSWTSRTLEMVTSCVFPNIDKNGMEVSDRFPL